MSIAQIIEVWNRFWFSKQSPLPLCVLRVFYGLLVIAYALQWLPDLANFFGPDALVTVKTLRHAGHATGFSIFFLLPLTDQLVTATWAVMFVAAVLSTIGLFTRASLIVTLLCILSFHHRNIMILHSGDSILRIIGFMLLFAPAGAMLSVDRLLRARKDGDAEPMMDIWPLRLVQLQLTALYCQTFFGKCAGASWFDGTAVYYASRLEDFYRFSVPYVFDHMWTCQLLTWGALGTEFALWALIWVKELRYPVLVLGCLLHLGIEWSMNIPFFELTMVAAYIAFVDPRHIKIALNKLASLIRVPSHSGLLSCFNVSKPISNTPTH